MRLSSETRDRTSGMDRLGIIHYLRGEIERMQAWQQRHQSRKQYAEETGQEKLWLLGIADAFTEELFLQEELDSMFQETDMFRKEQPKKPDFRIQQFPHCDQRILHAPGDCVHCDQHPEWQALRLAWGIAFTGFQPENNELPCPANKARGEDVDQRWGGNLARPETKKPD